MASVRDLPQWLETDLIDGVTLLRFRYPLVLQGQAAEVVADLLTRAASGPAPPRLVLNCQHVTMLSSLMLGKLVVLARKAARAGGLLAICNAQPAVASVVVASGLAGSLPLYPDERSALDITRSPLC